MRFHRAWLAVTLGLLFLVSEGRPNSHAFADVTWPAIFSEHMVLQQDRSLPVWGWAEPGEEVKVSLGGQELTTNADDKGRWRVTFDALRGGGEALTLSARGKSNTVKAEDVLIGEVWLGSGQSNMAMTVNRARDFERERAAANLPQIRLFREDSTAAAEPGRAGKGRWVICSPETVGTFSATAFYFGRELHQALGRPVGLVVSAVGGTPIESWIDADVQHSAPELKGFFEAMEKQRGEFDEAAAKARYERQLARWKEAVAKARAANEALPARPRDPVEAWAQKADVGRLFNGNIVPLIPYAIRGALWYQGEANTNPPKGPFYRYQLPLLVRDWRGRWGQGDFPFAWVQLPDFKARGRDWVMVREAMREALSLPNTGMAVTIDIGDPGNIHPTNKQDVGKRLAQWALATVYGKDVASSGPLPVGSKIKGNEVIVSFSHADGGLVAKGGQLKGFELAGADGQWRNADAKIVGESVVISTSDVKVPVAARYAWSDVPVASLYNGAGLPASPFRTSE